MKTCSKCKQEKPLSEFHPNKTSKSGLQSQCKRCHADYVRDKRKADVGNILGRCECGKTIYETWNFCPVCATRVE